MDIQDFGKHPLADRSLWVVRASAIALNGNGSLRHPRVKEADISLGQRIPCLSLLPIMEAMPMERSCREDYRFFNGGVTVADFCQPCDQKTQVRRSSPATHTVNTVPTIRERVRATLCCAH